MIVDLALLAGGLFLQDYSVERRRLLIPRLGGEKSAPGPVLQAPAQKKKYQNPEK
jgi:hypothetical protein